MSANIIAFLEQLFVGPVWPASVLVCLLILSTLVSLLGLMDFDFGLELDADFDADLDADLSGGFGATTLRWMNLQNLPLIVWMSIFTVVFWGISYGLWYGFDVKRYEPTLFPSILLVLRNGVIAVGLTKVLTEPLNRYFAPAPTFGPSNLIGKTCEVSTGEVSESFGQARFKTDASPLILNIRTDGEQLPKGSIVSIVAYDTDKRIYKVTAASEEEVSA